MSSCSSSGYLGAYVPDRFQSRVSCDAMLDTSTSVGIWPAPNNCANAAWNSWNMNATGGSLGCQAPLDFTQIAQPRDVGYVDSLMIQGNGFLTVNRNQSTDIRGDLPLPGTVACLEGASMPSWGPYGFAIRVRGWGY